MTMVVLSLESPIMFTVKCNGAHLEFDHQNSLFVSHENLSLIFFEDEMSVCPPLSFGVLKTAQGKQQYLAFFDLFVKKRRVEEENWRYHRLYFLPSLLYEQIR